MSIIGRWFGSSLRGRRGFHFDDSIWLDYDGDFRNEVTTELDRDLLSDDAADWIVQANSAHVDSIAFDDQLIADISLRDRTIEHALIVASADKCQRNAGEAGDHGFALGALLGQMSLCDRAGGL